MNEVNKTTIFNLVLIKAALIMGAICAIGCTPISQYQIPLTAQQVINRAESQAFQKKFYDTSYFRFTAWEKFGSNDSNITHIYIEGDGNSWKTKYILSDNPTPKQPLALKLAIQDNHSHVIYLARPCQYLLKANKHCHAKYWSSHRYSQTVVNNINEVLTQIKKQQPKTQFILIGFSGGGTLAALLSSIRTDVKGLITVAGNLDHVALGKYHEVSPLKGSLNPIDYPSKLRTIPQRHYVGHKDSVVPPWVAERYAQSLQSNCLSINVIKNYGHHKGWEQHWPELIQQPLPCQVK